MDNIEFVKTAECPVCCRQVAVDLLDTHVNVCVDRSGDCEIGVPVYPTHRPQTAVAMTRGTNGIGGGTSVLNGLNESHTGGIAGSNTSVMTSSTTARPATAAAHGYGRAGESASQHPFTQRHQPNNSQYYKHYNDNYYTPADEVRLDQSGSARAGGLSAGDGSDLSSSNRTAMTGSRYEVNMFVEGPTSPSTSAAASGGATPSSTALHANPVSSEKVAQLLQLFPPGIGLPVSTSREVIVREALAASGDDVDIAAMILLEAGSGWVVPPQATQAGYSAADAIETPRGSMGSSNFGDSCDSGSINSGRGYALPRPPSSRSVSAPRHGGPSGGAAPVVVVSSRHRSEVSTIDDEITAEVIGAPTGTHQGGMYHHHHQLNPSRRLSTSPSPAGVNTVVSARGPAGQSSTTSTANHRSNSRPSTASASAAVGGASAATTSGRHNHHAPRTTSKVELIVYDLKPDMGVAKKLGLGAYHSGVVVYGSEIAFGGTANLHKDSGRSGIWAAKPGRAAAKVHERIIIGETRWTAAEIRGFIKEWGSKEFIVDNYHLLCLNCNHFSERFLARLGERGRLLPESAYFTQTYGSGGYGAAITAAQHKQAKARAKALKLAEKNGGGNMSSSNNGDTPISTPTTSNEPMISPTSNSTIPNALPLFVPSISAPPSVIDEVCGNPAAIKAAFQLPPYVNRAASVGQRVVPDFIFKALMQKVNPPPAESTPNAGGQSAKGQKPKDNNKNSASAATAAAHTSPARPSTASSKLTLVDGSTPKHQSSTLGAGGVGAYDNISPYPLPSPGANLLRHFDNEGSGNNHTTTHTNRNAVTRREYESVCFMAAALGMTLTPPAIQMEAAIASSPSKEHLVIPIPPTVTEEDHVFTKGLKALRMHNGDTSSALEYLLTNGLM